MGEFRFAEPAAQLSERRCLSGRRLALGTLVLAISLGCGCTESQPSASSAPKSSGVATPALKVGDPLPQLRAEGWVNGPPSAPDSPGVRLLVVDAWGSWCPFCDRSAPGLVRVHKKYSGQGVAFASLTSSGQGMVESYVRKHSIPWPNGYGVTAQTAAALGAGSGMPGPIDYEVAPTLYLVGPDGRIRWVDGRGRSNHQNPQEWEAAVDAAIAETLASLPKAKP